MKKLPKKKTKVTEVYFNEYDDLAETLTYNTGLKSGWQLTPRRTRSCAARPRTQRTVACGLKLTNAA